MPYMRNKRTGEVIEVDATGRPVGQRPPPNPTFDLQRPKVQADIGQTQASTANTQVNAQKTQQEIAQSDALFDAQKREAEAKAQIAQMQAQAARAETESKNPLNLQALQGASADAMSKLQAIDRIRQNIDGAWLPAVGMGAETVAGLGGTNARNVQAEIGSLKSGGALSEVLKMTQATGKNPFTPMSNSDVDLISKNVANLDQGQSPTNFNSNLTNYQNAYTKAYAIAEGLKTLNSEIERLLPTIPPQKREAFKQDALRRYNARMTSPRLTPPPRNAPRKGGGARFLGWED